jgi:hypothetical protein
LTEPFKWFHEPIHCNGGHEKTGASVKQQIKLSELVLQNHHLLWAVSHLP